jgi:hypothetical protein
VVASGDRSPLDRCATCDSRLPAGADWCGLCLARVPRTPANLPHPLLVAVPPPVARAPSRTKEGALSFGLTGRIAITLVLAVVGVAGLLFFLIPYFATHSRLSLAYAAIFLGPFSVVAFFVLRDVWKRSWQPLEVLQEHPWKPPSAREEGGA